VSAPRPKVSHRFEVVAGPWDHEGRCRTPLPGGFELRVDDAIPGESLTAEVTHVSRGGPVGWAKVAEMKKPHPARRRPPCGIHGLCGACGIQHVGDDAQLGLKVESALPGLPPALARELVGSERWIRSPLPFGYRHKAVWLPGERGGRPVLGGYARGTHDVVDLAECSILAPPLRALHDALVELLPTAPRGLRSVVARASRSGEALATVVVHQRDRRWADAVHRLPAAGVHLQLHDEPGDAVTGRGAVERLVGRSWIEETVASRVFRLLPLGFFQVNPGVLEGIVDVVSWAMPRTGRVLDVCCGGGVLGLAATDPAVSLLGFDTSAASVRAAELDAERQGRADARFEVGPAARVLGGLDDADIAGAIVDPPRAGLKGRDRDALIASAPARIAYVSCHTASLAKDAAAFLEAGWRPTTLVPADMLPQTPHVEWVAVFERD